MGAGAARLRRRPAGDCRGIAQRDLIDSVALIATASPRCDLFTESVIISEEVINNTCRVSSPALLHNHASLSGIASAQRLFPEVMQVAVFDTSFHLADSPREAFSLWSAVEYYQNLGVRRYGFHGTSHRYVSQRALALLGLPEQESGLVIAHPAMAPRPRGA